MRRLAIAAVAALSVAAATCQPVSDEHPSRENWDSTTMEATSILGEFLYQNNEHRAAKEMFSDSLGTSTRIRTPQARIMAMDLYRSAQIEIKEGNLPKARYHLEILINRYGDTTWAQRGEALLKTLPADIKIVETEEVSPTGPDPMQPEMFLKRLQAALREGKNPEAMEICRTFLGKYSGHPFAPEVRLTQAALMLGAGDAASAQPLLEHVAQEKGDPALVSKARYLLGLAYLAEGDKASVLKTIPEKAPAGDRWAAMALVWRGLAAAQSGQWAEGQSMLKRSLKSRFNSPVQAYALAGLAAAESHRKNREASTLMREASREAKQQGLGALGEYALLTLGHMFVGQRRYAEAAKAYAEFETAYPSSPDAPEAAYQTAMAWKRAKNLQLAGDAFLRLAKKYPDSPKAQDAYLQLGQIYTEQGAPEKAIAAFRQMGTQGGGSDKDATLLIAKVHYNRKEFSQAIPIYERFLQDWPDDSRAFEVQDLLLSSYWLGARDHPGLSRAVEAYPNHPLVAHIRWALGARIYKSRNYAAAEAHFRGIIADFPKSTYVPGSLYYQAECLAQMQNYAGAASAYRQLMNNFPKSQYAREVPFKLGLALMQAGDYEGSAEAYRKFKPGAKDPLAADALFNRALALDKSGRKSEAIAGYEALLGKFPKYPRASWIWMQIGSTRQAEGKYSAAAQAYARVTGSERIQAVYSIAWCREKLKQRPQALKAYEQLVKMRPEENPFRLKGMLRLALLYELSSDRRAKGLYQDVLALSADPALTNVARKRLGLTSRAAAPPTDEEGPADLETAQAETPVALRSVQPMRPRGPSQESRSPRRAAAEDVEPSSLRPPSADSSDADEEQPRPAPRRNADRPPVRPARQRPAAQPSEESVTFLH
ncbi:MAG: tetratricopeptide repeat protein [Elusimicrobia bacterium]|nr:tetratricopeptide repeat protein [Elusimicrobiota bacterium]